MPLRVNPALAAAAEPPIAEAYGWIKGREFPADKPLIDVSQAVPGYPPARELTDHLAARIGEPGMARYTDIEGLPELREALAEDIAARYGAAVAAEQIVISAGCNQGFCLATLALAKAGDEIILPLPYYFNHQMWFDMQGIRALHLPFRPERGGVPDPEDAARLITERTRAIVLVTPNNPTGSVYPPEAIAAFYRLAGKHGLALVIDETYRDFLATDAPPHALFHDPAWPETLVHLYSFSKVFCLTGYRVGAVACGRRLGAEIAKAMDTVAICAPRIGQVAAIHGLRALGDWRHRNAEMMRGRLAALRDAFRRNDIGYELISSGAYFAYVRHPHDGRPAAEVARRLADTQNILCLPGSMFGAGQESYLRFAFANVAAAAMPAIGERLAADARA